MSSLGHSYLDIKLLSCSFPCGVLFVYICCMAFLWLNLVPAFSKLISIMPDSVILFLLPGFQWLNISCIQILYLLYFSSN